MSFIVPSDFPVPEFNRHKKAAGDYANMVTGVNGILTSALTEVNRVNSMLNVDKKGANDLLTFNVAASNAEMKSEIETIQTNLSTYSGLISGQAKVLDDQERSSWIAQHQDDSAPSTM